MRITFITLFPEVYPTLLNFSILKRAQEKGLVEFEVIDLRKFGIGSHKSVDDRPYGGGAGMVLRADVLAASILDIQKKSPQKKTKVILTSASGQPFKQNRARRFLKEENLVIISGHYEGVDQRFIDKYVDSEISIGDYVLTGGELPSLVIADAIVRLLPEVLEKQEATLDESFEEGLLEYPHYTRPDIFEGKKVPNILKGGNHQKIKEWRKAQSLAKTKKIRPDLTKA